MNTSPVPEPSEDQQDPNTDTQDELGALEGHSQQPDEDEVVGQGAQPEAAINPRSRVTAGRHVKHEEGKVSAARRAKHVANHRKQHEKDFAKKAK